MKDAKDKNLGFRQNIRNTRRTGPKATWITYKSRYLVRQDQGLDISSTFSALS